MKFKPSAEFNKKNKERFLAAFDAHYATAARAAGIPATHAAPRFVFIMKVTAGAFTIMAVVFGGASVYADTTNVPADNALYPLKRLSESVQLTVTPSAGKAELQAAFAARRVAEMDDLEERKPTSTIIAKLADDADDSVNASIMAAAKADIRDGKLTDLCGKLLSTVATSSVAARGRGTLIGRADLLLRFTDRCETTADIADGRSGRQGSGKKSGKDGPKMFAVPMAAPSTSVPAPEAASLSASDTTNLATGSAESTESSTLSATAAQSEFPVADLEVKIRTYLDRHWSGDGDDGGDRGGNE